MVNLMNSMNANKVNAGMCPLGLDIEEEEGIRQPVKKPTMIMNNSERVLSRLERRCEGGHEHMSLYSGGHASNAQVYPDKMCRESMRGLETHLEEDGRMGERGMAVHLEESSIRYRETTSLETNRAYQSEYYDDMSGEKLSTEGVGKARAEEMKAVSKHSLYTKVPTKECWGKTGKGPIGTRWVDVNKGDEVNSEYRSRLVAQEVKADKREDLVAATPPLEANTMLMSLAMTEGMCDKGRQDTKA